jgi:hypothetical protein
VIGGERHITVRGRLVATWGWLGTLPRRRISIAVGPIAVTCLLEDPLKMCWGIRLLKS